MLAKVSVEVETGCWLWTGGLYPNGYAAISVNGRVRLAHRVAYQLLVGAIPDGLDLDHVRARGCRHRHCINPDHLEPVTRRENLMRGDTIVAANAAKTHCLRGHPFNSANTEIQGDGARKCRRCKLDREEAKRRSDGVPLGNSRKTHCPRGHEYNEANTRVEVHGGSSHRKCRTCDRERARVRKAAKRARGATSVAPVGA